MTDPKAPYDDDTMPATGGDTGGLPPSVPEPGAHGPGTPRERPEEASVEETAGTSVAAPQQDPVPDVVEPTADPPPIEPAADTPEGEPPA